jgi:hypothetical protein
MRHVTVRPTRDRRPAPLAAGLIAVLAAAASLAGCLDRDTVAEAPTVKTNFETSQSVTSVDQVDILFMIDNSTSMGDKQILLSQAVPNLVTRLVQPNCLDTSGNPLLDGSGNNVTVDPTTLACATGTPEFPAVHDMHIGIVSSSIGDFGVSEGGDSNQGNWACPARDYTTPDNAADGGVDLHTGNDSQNDHAQLLNRTQGFDTVAGDPTSDPQATSDADPDNYLSWFPSVSGNSGKTPPVHPITVSGPVGTAGTLSDDFRKLVLGVNQFGCGFEGQLESWYQFLIQPDPWASIAVTGNTASRVGVNTTVLKQRADFLRPNSLVAVIAVSDEDDSTVDPGAFSGTSWVFEDRPALPLPTAACATDPASSACTSCQIACPSGPSSCPNNPECAPAGGGTGVATYETNTQPNDPDAPNVRFALMKKRFGIDPQYPISRYLNGLVGTNGSFTVPDRNGERHDSNGRYAPTNDCTNPLYAASQPDLSKLSATVTTDTTVSTDDLNVLCKLPAGTRDPSLVFFGFIGGVPWQLLTKDPNNANATNSTDVPFIAQSSGDDIPDSTWTQLIGTDPENYNYSGQSPYMQVSLTPRAGLQPVTASNTADPFNGREYTTNGTDLEYACTFQLPTPLDCSDQAIAADYPKSPKYDGLLRTICDCANTEGSDAPPTGPLCGSGATINTQIRGKAYPGIREFTLVHDMDQQTAANGIAASLCPRTLDTSSADYGYNPAVDAIIAKLKNALGNTCLPRSLTLTNGLAPCRVLELLPTGQQTCDASKGLSTPTKDVADNYRHAQAASGNGDASAELESRTLCLVNPIQSPCYNSTTPGWCYETKTEDPTLGVCTQAVKFSPPAVIPGAIFSLECLESATAPGDGGN